MSLLLPLVFLLGAASALFLLRRRPPAMTRNTEPTAAPEAEVLLAEERERIYADLHDDIGARLLSLVYAAPDPRQADLARSILQDLRDVVSRSRGEPGTLLQVLGELRRETERRLATVGLSLDWQQSPDLEDADLDRAQGLHLARILREGVSNVIQHAGAGRLRIRVQRGATSLLLELADDGSGAGVAAAGQGRGTANMAARAEALAGAIAWTPSTAGGTRVSLRMPLPEAPRVS